MLNSPILFKLATKCLGILCIIVQLSCAMRGLQLSEQIPEYHKDYDTEKKMIYAQGEDFDKVIFDNSQSEEQRALTHETVFLSPRSKAHISKQKRGLASTNHIESENYLDVSSFEDPRKMSPPYPSSLNNIFFSADPNLKRSLASVQEVHQVKSGETVENLLRKNCVTALCWKKFIINNPNVFKLDAGDSIKITKEVRP